MASIASTKSVVLMDKIEEILLNNNTDISNTRLSHLDDKKTMPGKAYWFTKEDSQCSSFFNKN